ncbi:MAG: exodeoxyribonuclease VII large subunit [Clostridia bacterium]|nr:exodeoxyribonuclease VII large subunit [Clostridia bacterium]MBR6553107.1 exodeoxyribonuclease VII large subunit [Clostridia bacterium]
MEQNVRAVTVEQLNTYIRDFLAGAPYLSNVTVKGELSNVRVYGASGHIYFTLKDEKSTIPATMFGGKGKLNFEPEAGMKVVCTGRVSVFVRDGQYRLYAESMEPDGIGALAIAFEQLKRKLDAEGLFSPLHKKKIPKIPFRVGIITAAGGAALRDMINVTSRRFPAAKLLIAPATVQGPNAPPELIRALHLLDDNNLCDVIIIGRGGGSMEDLWCFNDEALAREIYACKTPIISAVGHEIDFTISDFVADLRAPTPSAAAELAVPDMVELGRKFGNVQEKMKTSLQNRVSVMSQRLQFLASRPVLTSPQAYFDDRKQQILSLEERLNRALVVSSDRKNQKLQLQAEKLRSLNPLAILDRGFSVALKEDGTILRTPTDVEAGEAFTLRMAKGEMKAVKTQEN